MGDTSEAEGTFNSALLNLSSSLPPPSFRCQCVPTSLPDDVNHEPNVKYPDNIHEQIFQTKTGTPYWIKPGRGIVTHEDLTVNPPRPAFVSFSAGVQVQIDDNECLAKIHAIENGSKKEKKKLARAAAKASSMDPGTSGEATAAEATAAANPLPPSSRDAAPPPPPPP